MRKVVVGWLSVLAQTQSAEGPLDGDEAMRCKRGYDLEFLANRRPINEFCPEHNHRTCCGRGDTRFLRGVFETMERKAEFSSEKCLEGIY